MMAAPALERHFVPGSIAGLLRRGHPYDFIETYRTVQVLYGYDAYYVNLGLWTDGASTIEAGRKLALRVAEPLQLRPGERLIDAGSGLGQAAIDLARAHALGSVRGLNINPRQLAFANELAAADNLADRVEHTLGDACSALFDLSAESADGVLAVECIGHFADPLGFLRGVHHVLRRGRRLSFCLNVAHGELTMIDRRLIRASFGFVPAALSVWEQRLAAAGLARLEVVDLTDQVTGALSRILTERLDCPTDQVRALPWSTRSVVKLLQRATRDAVERGRLKYLLITAERR